MKTQVDPKQLETTVRELKERAAAHRDYIKGHETRTRSLLIDPLLRGLGWDTEDPDAVQLEYKLAAGFADYALMNGDTLAAVIEAKRLGTGLGGSVHLQVIQYIQDPACSQIDLVAFTNGDDWVFCRRSDNWKALRVKISGDQPFATAYDLVDCLSARRFQPPPPSKHTVLKESVVFQVTSQATPLPDADWKKKPARVRFEDGSEQEVNSWPTLYLEVSRHVVDKGLVKPDDYPVVLARSKQIKKCAMNTSPVHPHGRRFGSAREVREGIWLEVELPGSKARRDYSVSMLERFGLNPASVQIEYAPVTIASGDSPPRP